MANDSLYQYYNPNGSVNKGDIVNGQYYWKNPDLYNPIPLPTVPGAQIKPDKTSMRGYDLTQGFVNAFPSFQSAVTSGVVPMANAQLQAQQATAPGQNELLLQLYKQYGPAMAQIGNQITAQNQLAQTNADNAAMTGAGRNSVQSALELAKLYDPEYFASRELTSNRLGDLLRSIDLGPGLSGSERAEIDRSLAQEGARRGNYNAPSNTDTVANAMKFGAAGAARQQQRQNMLSQAIAASTQFLPAAKSGADTFAIGSGRTTQPNTGEQRFAGIQKPDSSATDLANSFWGGLTGLKTTELNNAAQSKDWMDAFGQITGGLGSLFGK